jgi:hypothetical protein
VAITNGARDWRRENVQPLVKPDGEEIEGERAER